MHDEPRVREGLAAIDALIARLEAGLTRADRRAGWTPESAAMWVEILGETRRDFVRAPEKAAELWIVRGLARQLDSMGTAEGELAEALYSLAFELGGPEDELDD